MNGPVIIFDNGSGYLKAGLSTSQKPDVTIPALVGRPMLRYAEQLNEVELKPLMIGDEIIPVRSLLELSYPITEGIIENEDDMFLLWNYCLTQKLNIKKDELKNKTILLTEAPGNPLKNKVKMMQILFEKLQVSRMNIEPQAKLTLICEGLTSGIVLDSGDGVSHCIPIFGNSILTHNIKRLNVAGRHITNYLTRLLQLKGYSFNSTADFETVKEIKEKYCFVSCDIESDRKLDKETTYYNSYAKLPDGRTIRVSNEKFEAPEILFSPILANVEQNGINDMVYSSIQGCPIDTRKELYGNIVLSGATTMFPGFASRIEKEIRNSYITNNLKNASDKTIKIKIGIIDSPRRKFSVFIGAGVLANIVNKDPNGEYWINKTQYDEIGGDAIFKSKNLQNKL